MITFKKLRWKNFLSTGNLFTEIDLNTHNTTLVVGENGAGKSTMLDALSYSLFGKPFRKINKPQLMNSITRKEMLVEIEFSITNNDYKIVRGIRPNVFEVYQNGNLMNQSAEMKDYQEIVEKQILKINHKSFSQVIVLGSATFLPFMQLPGGQRREIIEDLLDLQIFTTMNSLLKDKITTNKEELIEISADQKVVSEKIKLIKEHMQEMQNNNDAIIAEKKEVIKETQEQIETLISQQQNIEQEAKDLAEKTANLDSLEKKMSKLQSLKHKIEANLDIVNKEVSFFNNHDNCPTCKQEIDNDFKCEAIDTRNININEIKDGLGKLSEEYDKVDTEIKNILNINLQVRQKMMDSHVVGTKINSLKTYMKQLNEEINSIQKTVEDQDDSKLSILEDELIVITEKTHKLNEDKIVFAAASSLLKDGGIKSKIIRQYIPIINKLINKYLSAMDFFVQFELDEEFNETIKSRHRDEFSYASFSEGEKMRINLAILFTWRAVAKLRNSINTNILIMDEVFDSSLDSNGTEEFMKILNTITTDTNTFIISHKTDQISDKFDNVIKFEKHKNFSRIAS
jgi:DNA repair exonuclease SbcCD ATPase subunit